MQREHKMAGVNQYIYMLRIFAKICAMKRVNINRVLQVIVQV